MRERERKRFICRRGERKHISRQPSLFLKKIHITEAYLKNGFVRNHMWMWEEGNKQQANKKLYHLNTFIFSCLRIRVSWAFFLRQQNSRAALPHTWVSPYGAIGCFNIYFVPLGKHFSCMEIPISVKFSSCLHSCCAVSSGGDERFFIRF